ncbi:fatty acid-binding protein 1-like [Achroia grisella]|uniref:fatty acid-binding protein 1-like n=1 Tax=Achroia grisella TaxID=688607 RepID=UPI0027D28BA9|nr:fatty acid-binding protein 1-like [Achroia grisella]
MAFLGKQYKYESEENFEAFLNAIDIPAEDKAKAALYRPTQLLEKDGDTYKYTTIIPQRTKTVTFQSGVEFDYEIKEGITIKSLFTVDGNTVTQVFTDPKGRSATFKREYNGDKLKVTVTTSVWDGVAYRYYSA